MLLNDIKIQGLAYDSRKVKLGDVFVAIPGYKVDGYDFIPQAIANGAKIIVSEKEFVAPGGVNKIIVPNARKALAELSNRFYGYPSKKMKMIGITGTNGKTTIAYLIESILSKAGYKVGLIGTVETKIAGKSFESSLTTPGSLELQALLNKMVEEGVTHVVMEVSSHSLAQYRVHGCEFDVAIYTNLTHDHLDFHKTMDQYLEEKKKLFQMLKKNSIAIINVDDKYSKEIAGVVESEIIFYGIHDAKHELRSAKHTGFDGTLEEFHVNIDEMRVKIDTQEIRTNLIGEFNVYNILAAYQCGLFFKVDRKKIKLGIEAAVIPGRLERIENNMGIYVFVDFAHTPDALKKTLEMLKPLTQGKLIVVFGCPGDRDRDKRPIMGKIAAELADIVIVTTDDPHTEAPQSIIDEILKPLGVTCHSERSEESRPKAVLSSASLDSSAMPQNDTMKTQNNLKKPIAQGPLSIVDRKEAIEKALSLSQKGDTVLIAGRGHEKFQDFNGTKVPLDDREVVRNALTRSVNVAN